MMPNQKNIPVLIVEQDSQVVDAIKNILQGSQYDLHILSSFNEALSRLKTEPFSIAIVGKTAETDSPFEELLEMVKASPLTSIILLSDLPEEEVHERSEGCGILGHVGRSVPPEDLDHLLNRFRQIAGLL
ncbi:MAG TPA: response regulator [Desulfobacteraceae bacterium]|nr:response regulator [Desulfobacteraceae bacterium]